MIRIFLYECISAGGLGANVPGSLAREGWAMLSAIVEDFQRVPDVQTFTLVDKRLPPIGDQCIHIAPSDEAARFQDIAAGCNWTLVIAPEFDDLLLDRSQAVLNVGGRLLGSAPEAIRLTGDKLATAVLWSAHGVPHPRTELIGQHCDAERRATLWHAAPRRDEFPPPWVVKPRQGAGSQATFLVRDPEEFGDLLAAARKECAGDLIVQQYIPGAAVSVALLIGPTQSIPLVPAWQHLSSDGRFRYEGGSLPLPAPLAQRAIQIATRAVGHVPGLQGYVGVDLVLAGGTDWAIEINPRLTTSYIGLRQRCRHNLAELMLHCACRELVEIPVWEERVVRFGQQAPP